MVGVCSKIVLTDVIAVLLRLISLPGDGWCPIVIVLGLAIFFYYKKKPLAATILISAPLLGNYIKYLLKTYYQVSRPAEFGCANLGNYGDVYSFPSGHTIFITILFGFCAYYLYQNSKKWLSYILVCWIVLIGFSRYLLGAHWVIDIFGGYLVGGAILLISILVYNHFSYDSK